MSLFKGDQAPFWSPLNSVFANECCECHCSLQGAPAKIVYDFPQDARTVQLCPRCARLVACRILLDCMRLEKGDAAVDAFWAARRTEVLEKAEALSEFADWPKDLKIYETPTT